ncbi:hypothetical protein [Burkholderia sp. 22PA0106]|uniref:hypothetical protein n=1 Tax=Burkholderia sp. 22PA0106 TaxID=3237371 RepID=UPI0039C17FD3
MSDFEESNKKNALFRSERFFQLIGMFCVHFEQICYEMEECAAHILKINGLANDKFGKIVLSNLTADPLQRMLRALLTEHLRDKGYDQVLHVTFRGFEDLTKIRNSLIHGKWTTPIDDENWRSRPAYVFSRKLKTSKNGEDSEYLKYTEKDFLRHIENCKIIEKKISYLYFLCAFPEKIGNYFNSSTGKLVI